MSTLAEYSKRKNELNFVNKVIRLNIAKLFDEDWNIELFYSLKEFATFVGAEDFVDFVCVDISESIAVSVVELIRKKNKETVIMLMADATVSPALYMKPSIMAASLLLFPLDENQVTDTIGELFRFMSAEKMAKDEGFFVIKSKSHHEHIPNSKIIFFESRDKKLFLNTSKKEYGFYETIDSALENLPDYFIRCHRSYIVNSRKIKKVMLSENLIELDDGIMIPVSKSYKPLIKEYRKNA